ncbi:MAG: hypothetical protein Q9174_006771, partial [Haloplaca sp. 1 TL-2023]
INAMSNPYNHTYDDAYPWGGHDTISNAIAPYRGIDYPSSEYRRVLGTAAYRPYLPDITGDVRPSYYATEPDLTPRVLGSPICFSPLVPVHSPAMSTEEKTVVLTPGLSPSAQLNRVGAQTQEEKRKMGSCAPDQSTSRSSVANTTAPASSRLNPLAAVFVPRSVAAAGAPAPSPLPRATPAHLAKVPGLETNASAFLASVSGSHISQSLAVQQDAVEGKKEVEEEDLIDFGDDGGNGGDEEEDLIVF